MKRQVFYILFFIPVFTSCLESPEMTTGIVNGKEKPTVISGQTEIPRDGTLLFQGEIVSEGKAEIIRKGFCWDTISMNPNIDNNFVTSNADTDIFSQELKKAKGGKTYYWRTFAENSFGFDYGEVQSCHTPEIWEMKQQLPANSRGRGAISLYNNKIYMTCGESDRKIPTNSTWIYDVEKDKWDEAFDFIGEVRIYPVVFPVKDVIFVGTGLLTYGYTHKDFYRYNHTLDEDWTKIDMPDDFEARSEAIAFSIDGKGYVVGGTSANRNELTSVWQYDPEDDSWLQKKDFPVPIYQGISISYNNQVFAGFGETNKSSRTLWKYDIDEDEWDEFTTLPDNAEIKKIYSGVIVQNTIYIIDEKNSIWVCNLSDMIWEKKTDLPSVFSDQYNVNAYQNLLTTGNSNSIYVGLGYSKYLYEYRPLWDN